MKEGHPVHRRAGTSRAQASRAIPCTSKPKSRAHTRRLPMCPNLGTAGSQFLGLLGNLLLGTLAWEPVPGNLLGTCCLAACSGAFTMAEDPKLTLLGKKVLKSCDSQELEIIRARVPSFRNCWFPSPNLTCSQF